MNCNFYTINHYIDYILWLINEKNVINLLLLLFTLYLSSYTIKTTRKSGPWYYFNCHEWIIIENCWSLSNLHIWHGTSQLYILGSNREFLCASNEHFKTFPEEIKQEVAIWMLLNSECFAWLVAVFDWLCLNFSLTSPAAV